MHSKVNKTHIVLGLKVSASLNQQLQTAIVAINSNVSGGHAILHSEQYDRNLK